MGRRKKKKRNINVRKNTIIEVNSTVGSMEIQTDTTATRAVFRSNKGEDTQTFVERMKNARPRKLNEFVNWDSPFMKEFNFFKDSYITDDGFIVPRKFIQSNLADALYENESPILEEWVAERFDLKKSFYLYPRQIFHKQVKPLYNKWLKKNLNDDLYEQVYPIVLEHLKKSKDDGFDDYLTNVEKELIDLQYDTPINIEGMSFRGKNGLWPIENFFGSRSDEINSAVYKKVQFLEDMVEKYYDNVPNRYGSTKENMSLEDYIQEELDYMQWMIDSISEVIMQLPPLHKDVILFRGGPFDETLEEGEIGEFKSPTSFSFKRGVAEGYADKGKWLYIVYAPEGSHLAAVNALSRFKGFHYSAGEVFNASNQKYVVLHKNTSRNIVTILLLKDGDKYQ